MQLAVYSGGATVEVIDRPPVIIPDPPPSPAVMVRPYFVLGLAPGRYSGTVVVPFTNPTNAPDGPAQLFVDGVVRATATIAAGQFSLDSSVLTNEPHSLHMQATPPGGMLGESVGSVTIWPNNAGRDPPTNPVPGAPIVNSPYLYFYIPATGTANWSYLRFQSGPYLFKGSKNTTLFSEDNPNAIGVWNTTVVVRCQAAGGAQQALTEPVQLVMDGVGFGAWVTPVGNVATFTVDSTQFSKGSHVLSAQQQTTKRYCEPILIEVNQDGIPLTGERYIWASDVWFDQEYAINSYVDGAGRSVTNLPPFRVRYPNQQPQFFGDPSPIPGRTRTPWATYIGPSGLWAEAVCTTVPTGWPRRFGKTSDGFVHTCGTMQYPHAMMESLEMPIYDGNRGLGGFGHAWAGQLNPATGGLYGISTQGRLWYLHINNRITTIAGRRKPLWSTPDRVEVEQVGNFIDAPIGFNEPWGYAHDPRDTAEPNNWLKHIVADSFNHRLCLVDNATARMPGGSANINTLVGLAGSGFADGTLAQAKTYTPWGAVPTPSGDGVVWSEYDSDYAAIRKLTFATLQVSTLFRSALPNPTRVGKPANRVIPALVGGQIIKGVDGPLATATGYYFQSIQFDSTGRLIVAEKFTQLGGGAIRRIDFAAQTITTLYVIPFDGNTRDVTIAVNADGTCGALDTIYGTCWGRSFVLVPNGAGYTFKGEIVIDEADGTWHNSLREGQANQVTGVSYPTLVACAAGAIVLIGTGAECGYRITAKQAGDPIINSAKVQSGANLYRQTWGMRHGIRGQDTLEGNGFAQVRQLNDADLAALLRSGWSLGYTVTLTDAQVSDLAYFIRWPKV